MTYDEGQSIVRPAGGNLSVLGRGLGPSQALAWASQGSRLGLQLLEA